MEKFIDNAVTSTTGFVTMDNIQGIAKNVNDLRNDINNLYMIFYKTFDGAGVGKFKVSTSRYLDAYTHIHIVTYI